jgi:hypothetical protein
MRLLLCAVQSKKKSKIAFQPQLLLRLEKKNIGVNIQLDN